MIWTIASREFLEYRKFLRFLIGFLVAITLVALSTFINVNDYGERISDYSNARKEMASSSYTLVVYRSPEVLSTLVQGLDRSLGNRASLNPFENPARTSPVQVFTGKRGFCGRHGHTPKYMIATSYARRENSWEHRAGPSRH